MAYGDPVSKPYTAGGTPTDSLSGRDLSRAAVGGLTPMVQEVTHEVTGHGTLNQTVTTPGTPVALSAIALRVRKAIVQMGSWCQGSVAIGDSNVRAGGLTPTSANSRGPRMNNPGMDTFTFEHYDLNTVYIDAQYAGDGVTVWYFS